MPAPDHRLIRFKALPDGFQDELIETAERGQKWAAKGVEPVEVFRMAGVGPVPAPATLTASPGAGYAVAQATGAG
ncbi:hypothetical protein QNO07_24090 [Streptomyces sp. 549]|nr:hypothetical protein [Streptomyces sp. 549]